MNLSTYDPYSHQTTSRLGKFEYKRRFAVRIIFLIFILSLIEGPLRKWFLPSLSGTLTLLRDPFVIALYVYCFRYGLIWKRGTPPKLWFWFACVAGMLGLIQYLVNSHGVLGWILGMRTYWLYMPLSFVIAQTFRMEDVLRFLRLVLILAVPYSVLVALQYNAPASSIINWGASGDAEASVALSDGIIRPFGLFTYLAPNTKYTAFTVAVFISYLLIDRKERSGTLFLLITGLAVATMSVLTGSRSIYFIVGALLVVTVFGLLTARPTLKSIKFLVIVICFVPISAVIFTQAFPDMLSAMVSRFERASNTEGGLWNRIYYSGFSFIDAFWIADLFGYGIGAGAPGVARFIGLPPLFLGEGDTQRNVRELGIFFGAMFLLLRWFTAGWLLKVSFILAMKRWPLALPLAGFSAMQISIAQVTNSPLSAFLPWVAFGLVAAVWKSLLRQS